MRRGLLLAAAAALLTLSVPAARPAGRPVRFFLAAAAGGRVALYESSDGVRFAAAAGFAPRPGTSAGAVRRGQTLYLYGAATLSTDMLTGTLWRFRVRASGSLAELAPASYSVQLASPEDVARATPGAIEVSAAVDDGGALVLLYGLRYEPATNACPAAGRACVKLRTATEQPGANGGAFGGDTGNRVVLGLDAAQSAGPPALLRTDRGWAVLLRDGSGCLRALTAASPHGTYRSGPCLLEDGPASPSGLWDTRLSEYRLYGVSADGAVVRAVTPKLRPLAPARFRPLALPVRPSAVRIAANAP
jgi:hypothetical protein